MTAFETATSVARTGLNTFTADVDPTWHVRRGANGGVVAAVLLRALEQTIDDAERVPRSLTVHYAGPFDEGPTTVTTAIEREGRSLTTASARATRADSGKTVALALAAFASKRPTVELHDIAMPDVPPPEDVEVFSRGPGVEGPSFAQHFEYRVAEGAPIFSGAPHAEAAVWIRPREPMPLDYPLLAALTDAFVPVLFITQTMPVMSPTVDLTIHFRRTLADLDPADEGPWLGVFRTRLAAEGYMEEDGEIWTRDGVLLAQSRQLALAAPVLP